MKPIWQAIRDTLFERRTHEIQEPVCYIDDLPRLRIDLGDCDGTDCTCPADHDRVKSIIKNHESVGTSSYVSEDDPEG